MWLEQLGDHSRLVRATLDLAAWDGRDEQDQAHEVYRVLKQHRQALAHLLAEHGLNWQLRPMDWPRSKGRLTEAQTRVLQALLVETLGQEQLLWSLVERGAQ